MLATECGLCGQSEFEPLWHRGHPGVPVSTVVCKPCGLVQTSPRPTQAELKRFYETDYRTLYGGSVLPSKRVRQHMTRQGESRYQDLSPHLTSDSRIMEMGCATGEFLQILIDRGYTPMGTELSPDCAVEARKKGCQVYTEFLEEHQFDNNPLDAVCLFHVLEHLQSPVDSLRNIRNWLGPEGILFLEVPDLHQPYHGNLSRFFQVAHLYSFSRITLETILKTAGFEPVWYSRFVEGKFLRMIARKTGSVSEIASLIPAEDWKAIKALMRQWRARWLSYYKWETMFDRVSSAVRRRLQRT